MCDPKTCFSVNENGGNTDICHACKFGSRQESILDEIRAERDRQDAKWGVQNHHPAVWMLILGEEVGEAVAELDRPECLHGDAMQRLVKAGERCEYVCERPHKWIRLAMTAKQTARYRAEMVQVAAVALSAIECLDRNAEQGKGGGR